MVWIITVYLTILLGMGTYIVSILAFADGAAISILVHISFCFYGIDI